MTTKIVFPFEIKPGVEFVIKHQGFPTHFRVATFSEKSADVCLVKEVLSSGKNFGPFRMLRPDDFQQGWVVLPVQKKCWEKLFDWKNKAA